MNKPITSYRIQFTAWYIHILVYGLFISIEKVMKIFEADKYMLLIYRFRMFAKEISAVFCPSALSGYTKR